MELSKEFDGVLMLTWSDWSTEPRSNRYHFATRFAKQLPVLFVQTSDSNGESLVVEKTEITSIEIVHSSDRFFEDQVNQLVTLMHERGISRPLVWIYNTLHFKPLIESLPKAFRVFHATEDYFSEGKNFKLGSSEVMKSVRDTLSITDLVVAVSDGVLQSYQKNGGYEGPAIVIENGCDAEHFFNLAIEVKQKESQTIDEAENIAIYQGGINSRLDFDLLNEMASILPEWNFWFCGRANTSSKSWLQLKSRNNVQYLGELSPDELAKKMCEATVGLIPFHQDELMRISLPLKAFEYVACGLPVVSIPIDALKKEPEFFSFATNAEDFAAAIRSAGASRHSVEQIRLRQECAERNSYDHRFKEMQNYLLSIKKMALGKQYRMNVALLYDDKSIRVNTVREHIDAFKLYSKHSVYFVPVTGVWTNGDAREIDLSLFDVLIIHYSVRLSLPDHLAEVFARQIECHMGLKILFIQDEYDSTEIARKWMNRLHFDIVYTCVPQDGLELIYPSGRFPTTDFLPTLTGYVPEDHHIESYAKPIRERSILIGYRGRKLPYIYGTLGYEKYRIGADVRLLAEKCNLPADIETDDSKRIYGREWYQFIGSVRATLGTESGSNIFDFDGTLPNKIQQVLDKTPEVSFDELHSMVLAQHEGFVKMNQISPKIFEAIRLRTALVLFEGSYSGVIQPHAHYIPLKKDYSNIEEVFTKLQDVSYLEELTARAYTDIVASSKYSYRQFVEGVDHEISARMIRRARYELFSSPIFALNRHGEIKPVSPKTPMGYSLSTHFFGNDLPREVLDELLSKPKFIFKKGMLTSVFRLLRPLWRIIPVGLRKLIWGLLPIRLKSNMQKLIYR